MTGNKITLYKASWNFSTLYQPYFKSDTARNSYFLNLPFIDATPTNGNVNIHFDYNLELSVRIPLDFTVAIDYNFCSIVYNDKTFYCNILDYKQVSVGYTELQLRRSIICERTDFFQYFERFQIGRATFAENFSYGKDTKFLIPQMRFIKKYVTPTLKLHWKLWNFTDQISDCKYIPCYIMFLDKGINAGENFTSYLYKEPCQYYVGIIPFDSVTVKYRDSDYYSNPDGDSSLHQLKTYSVSIGDEDLDKLSPYIKSLYFTYLPVTEDDMLPYICETVAINGIEGWNGFSNLLYILNTEVTILDMSGEPYPPIGTFTDYFSFDYLVSLDELFGSITIICYSEENRYTIPIYWKLNNSGYFSCTVNLFINIQGSSYQLRIIGQTDSVNEDEQTNILNFSLGDSTSYSIDAASNFDAQNRYYDAMTRTAKRQQIVGGIINAGTELALGVTQFGFARKMGPVGQLANNAMGIGNVIRAVGTTANMINDVTAYAEQREQYKSNEKSKPDKLIGGENAVSRANEYHGAISLLIEKPFDEDYNSWLDDKETYGIECDIHRNSIDLTEFSVNNKFFIQAIPVKKDNTILSVQEYNELYNFIKDGCRYFIVEDTESNKLDGGE